MDIIGKRFNQLTVLAFDGIKDQRKQYRCRCDCGNITVTYPRYLKSGHTKSCGCIKKHNNRKHGMSQTKLYYRYHNMKDRCYKSSHPGYKDYGGRGIYICDRWLKSFNNFMDDMGDIPFKGATIDRINNDGPYSPGNCQWSDIITQANNRRSNKLIYINGKIETLAQWLRFYNTPRHNYDERVRALGWP